MRYGRPAVDESDQALFRETIERRVRERCRGSCRFCRSPYGGSSSYGGWDDLASWIFGYCSNRCRLAAGEPQQFDIEAALKVLYSDSN
jgi:hypothetical protein